MGEQTAKHGVLAGIGLWILATLIKGIYAGFLTAIINPFHWLLSLLETVEFFIWLSQGGSLTFFLNNLVGREAGLILAGLFGLAAWAVTVFAGREFVSKHDLPKRHLVLLVFYFPLVALIGAAWTLSRTESVESSSTGIQEPDEA